MVRVDVNADGLRAVLVGVNTTLWDVEVGTYFALAAQKNK
jgi:hypothetical protein